MSDGAAINGKWDGTTCAVMTRSPLTMIWPRVCEINCKRCGLSKARRNDLCDRFMDLDGKAFTPTHVRGDLLIFAGCAMKRKTAKPATSKTTPSTNNLEATEQKGDILICDLWQNGTDSVHNTHVVNTFAKSYSANTP